MRATTHRQSGRQHGHSYTDNCNTSLYDVGGWVGADGAPAVVGPCRSAATQRRSVVVPHVFITTCAKESPKHHYNMRVNKGHHTKTI